MPRCLLACCAVLCGAATIAPAQSATLRTIECWTGLSDVTLRGFDGPRPDLTIHHPRHKPRTVPMIRNGDTWSARIRVPSGWDITIQPAGVDAITPERADPLPRMELVPAWAMGAVYYQVFPERFRNGDPSNDPAGRGVFPIDWNADWYEVSDRELLFNQARAHANGYRIDPGRAGGLLYEVVWHRRAGGDLAGVVEKMPHLVRLGVDVIYLTPVFIAESDHKYDASDHRHIDPTFAMRHADDDRTTGTLGDPADPSTWGWTSADRYFVDVFLPAAKAHGLRVMLDGVWNHTGRQHFAFQHVLEHGRTSPFAEWFAGLRFDGDGRISGWRAWDGENGWLPEFAQTPEGDLVEPVKAHIFAVTARWMDPNGDGNPSDGIDGWRLDVAAEIAVPFWRDWREHVRAINPEAALICEIWYGARDWLGANGFDAQMNYPLADAATKWLGRDPAYTSEDLARELTAIAAIEPRFTLAQMNPLDSHDVERLPNMLLNPGRGYDRSAAMHDEPDPAYDAGRPSAAIYDRAILGAALLATWPGAPMIYYGSEYAMYGADDPDNRKPMPWPDLSPPVREDEAADEAFFERYAEWFNLRQHHRIGPILRFGALRTLPAPGPDTFIFERSLDGDRVVVVLHRGDEPASFTLPGDADQTEPHRLRPRSGQAWLLQSNGPATRILPQTHRSPLRPMP
jgi:cyclomaltodextrinase